MSDTATVLDRIDQLQAKPRYKLTVDNISALILKNFNQTQIAHILGVSKQAVDQYVDRHADILRPLIDNTDAILAQRFKRHAIDYLDSIDVDDIKKASLLQRITSAGIVTEKYRLLSDKSTENISVMITDGERSGLQQIAAEAAKRAIREQISQQVVDAQDIVVNENSTLSDDVNDKPNDINELPE